MTGIHRHEAAFRNFNSKENSLEKWAGWLQSVSGLHFVALAASLISPATGSFCLDVGVCVCSGIHLYVYTHRISPLCYSFQHAYTSPWLAHPLLHSRTPFQIVTDRLGAFDSKDSYNARASELLLRWSFIRCAMYVRVVETRFALASLRGALDVASRTALA